MSSYYAVVDNEGRVYRDTAWDRQREERRIREGGLRADAAGFRPGQREHRMSGLTGEWEEEDFEKRRS